ncbi:hypothetical protein ACFRU3_34685 [Streptomyces sp. NPDC056910]
MSTRTYVRTTDARNRQLPLRSPPLPHTTERCKSVPAGGADRSAPS